jgi:hypothetical protein
LHQFLSDKPAGSGRCKGNKLKRYSGIPATLLCPFSKAPLSISRTAACRQSTAQNSFNFALETHLIYAIWRRIRSLKAPLSELRLASSGFTPHQMLFPVSAVMMRDRSRYDEVLESFSQSVSPYIDYELHQDGSLVVNNQTAHLYKFWDATMFAEYLYDCVAETIRTDLREEIGFLKAFDAAIRATMDIVDMPDRRAS